MMLSLKLSIHASYEKCFHISGELKTMQSSSPKGKEIQASVLFSIGHNSFINCTFSSNVFFHQGFNLLSKQRMKRDVFRMLEDPPKDVLICKSERKSDLIVMHPTG